MVYTVSQFSIKGAVMSQLDGKTIVVLLAKMHDEREFWYPVIRLKEAGATVLVAGEEAGKQYLGKSGLEAKSEVSWSDIRASDIDGIVIPGGFGPDFMRRSSACIQLVKEVSGQGKLVAFICHAAWVPISAGILKGRTATSYPSIKDDVVNAGCRWEDKSMVHDGNFVSSRNPEDLPDFMKGILAFFG